KLRCDFCGAFIATRYDTTLKTPEQARARFDELVRAWDLTGTVTYHGTVKGDAKHRFLEQAHVFVLPSYYSGEGQPVSILEALSYGTPIVATQYRGIPELLRHKVNGLFVHDRSPQDIS